MLYIFLNYIMNINVLVMLSCFVGSNSFQKPTHHKGLEKTCIFISTKNPEEHSVIKTSRIVIEFNNFEIFPLLLL